MSIPLVLEMANRRKRRDAKLPTFPPDIPGKGSGVAERTSCYVF